jgi:hypothetical protein
VRSSSHILVQQFVRIQFRAVRRQQENPEFVPGALPATASPIATCEPVAIHNQKHLLPGLPRQAQETTKKIQKHPRRETLTENHEGQPPPVGDGRNHVATKALTGTKYHWRLSASSVGSSRLMVRTKPHLVQPMNLYLKLSRLGSNRWIFFLQPFPHRGRILLIRSPHRLLRGQTPSPQIAPHRPHRDPHIEFSDSNSCTASRVHNAKGKLLRTARRSGAKLIPTISALSRETSGSRRTESRTSATAGPKAPHPAA